MLTVSITKYDMGYAGFEAKVLTQVRVVSPDSPAEKAGLKAGDVILAINGQPVFENKFIDFIAKNPEKELEFTILRNDQTLTLRITPRREGQVGKIGISPVAKSAIKKYPFFAAIQESVRFNAKLFFMVIDVIKNLATGQVSTKQLGGPIRIANWSYSFMRLGFMAFVSWIAFISLQLGVLNLFPIPVFDGGQLFVLILEGLFRRDLSPKAKQIWMQIGFVIFILLIGFVLLNDIVNSLPNGWKSLVPF
jgi:regulator of sigma E protease